MIRQYASLPEQDDPVVSYQTAMTEAVCLALGCTFVQALLWALPWLSGAAAAGSLCAVLHHIYPYETGFILFCSLVSLPGTPAGLALGWIWKKNRTSIKEENDR